MKNQVASRSTFIRRSRIMRMLAFAFLGAALPSAAELTPALQTKLDKEDFVITDHTFKQGFSAYLGREYPAFITSDSILMAYTTLLEKVVGQRHLTLFGAHTDLVAAMAKNLPERADEKAEVQASRLFIGCAYRILLGALPEGLTDAEGKLVELEAQRVEKAEGSRPPDWWGSKKYTPYSRFLPTSTWSQSAPLRRYYRYSQWMQSLPVDGAKELHVKICEHLYQVIDKIGYDIKHYALDSYSSGMEYGGILSEIEDAGNISFEDDPDELTEKIREILKDHSHFITFNATLDKALIDEQLDTFHDLTLLTGSVGKALGNQLVWPDKEPSAESQNLSHELRASTWRPDSLYLGSLMKLNEPMDKRAPKLFHSEAWQRKQLNCTMGAWAEYRHAMAITQTTVAHYGAMIRQDPGYIEPVPDFFHALGTATERLADQRLDDQSDRKRFLAHSFALRLEELADIFRNIKTEDQGNWISYTSVAYRNYEDLLNGMFKKNSPEGMPDGERWDITSEKDRKDLTKKIEITCQKFWSQDPDVQQQFAQRAQPTTDNITSRLYKLALLCLRLERLARRQLAGLERSDAEVNLIMNYGKTLGYLMFYEGNSYLSPRDDAPKIVQIAHFGQPGSEQVLQCGTARPRQLLIR